MRRKAGSSECYDLTYYVRLRSEKNNWYNEDRGRGRKGYGRGHGKRGYDRDYDEDCD